MLMCHASAGEVAPPAAVAAAPESRPQVVRVGASTDSYPYSFLDQRGQPTGFAVDLLDAVARVMGLTIQRELGTGLEINRRFARGEFDANQLFSATPDRMAYSRFSVPYLIVNGAIFARRDDSRFASIDDVRRLHAVVSTAGGPANNFAVQQGLSPDQLRTTSTEDAIRQVAQGRADVCLISRLSGLAQIHRLGIKNVAPVGPQIGQYPSHFCFAVRRDNEELLTHLNEGLAILHQTGEFDLIYRRWFSRYEPSGFTRNQVIAYVAGALAVALIVAVWGLLRQRQLRRRVASQAAELAEHRAMLAEAQSFATLGHWQRLIGMPDAMSCSEETHRVFERDPALGPPRDTEELLAWAGGPDVDRWRGAIESTLAAGSAYDLDLTIEPRAGRRKTIHARGRVVRDGSNNVIGLFGTVQDITARRAAEMALQRSERLLRAFYENLPHAVGVVEQVAGEWRIVSLNRGALTYFELTDAPELPAPLARLGLAAEVQAEWQDLLTRCATATAPFKVESHVRRTRREFVITLVPLGPEVQPVQCYFLVEDVTERRDKDAEIAQGRRLRALGALVGGIAHEFNNLLTPILMKADELHHDASDPQLRADVGMIADAARRSAELTRRLLAFGRDRSREPEAFEIQAVVENNVALLRQTIDRRIDIERDFPRGLPPLFLCSSDVHQILLNLLLNARDTLVDKLNRNPPAGWQARIRINAKMHPADAIAAFDRRRQPQSWIQVEVQDNGMGMPPGVIERVFEPFYTTKGVGRGTGLGLATVWHLINELGGRIDVESAAGEGSTFRVSLPVYPATRGRGSKGKTATATATPVAKSMRLLVVDDEPIISGLLSTVLHRQGHHLTTVQQGDEAWNRISAAPNAFDALILDLNMPGISGLELAKRARALPFHGRIMIMSGHVNANDRRELEHIGVTTILHKPFSVEEFLTAFAQLDQQPRADER
jgi:two-component system, cell cycle sensor histidine kinase and response regulator CckA